MTSKCREALADDIPVLAQLWHDGWTDAHAAILPARLLRARTQESFRERLEQGLQHLRVIDDAVGPAGFSYVKQDELYQFYVHARARGSGLSQRLMHDVDDHFARSGVKTAWLACAIGNRRAARFYEKSDWRLVGVVENILQLPDGPFPLDVWRYEKSYRRPAGIAD